MPRFFHHQPVIRRTTQLLFLPIGRLKYNSYWLRTSALPLQMKHWLWVLPIEFAKMQMWAQLRKPRNGFEGRWSEHWDKLSLGFLTWRKCSFVRTLSQFYGHSRGRKTSLLIPPSQGALWLPSFLFSAPSPQNAVPSILMTGSIPFSQRQHPVLSSVEAFSLLGEFSPLWAAACPLPPLSSEVRSLALIIYLSKVRMTSEIEEIEMAISTQRSEAAQGHMW